MTVTAHFFGKGVLNLAKGKMNLSSDTLKVALLSSSLDLDTNRDSYEKWSDVSSAEITSSGYTAGGVVLTNVTVTLDSTNHQVKLSADDPYWENSSSTITAHYMVLYDNTSTDKLLVGYSNFGDDKSATNVEFKLDFVDQILKFNIN